MMAKPVYRCPYCLTTKITEVDLGSRCPGCFIYLPKDLQPLYKEKKNAFIGIRSIGKISKPQAIAGLILIIVALGYFTSLDKSKNSSYSSNRQSGTVKRQSNSRIQKRAVVDINQITNMKQLFDIMNKNISRNATCRQMGVFLPGIWEGGSRNPFICIPKNNLYSKQELILANDEDTLKQVQGLDSARESNSTNYEFSTIANTYGSRNVNSNDISTYTEVISHNAEWNEGWKVSNIITSNPFQQPYKTAILSRAWLENFAYYDNKISGRKLRDCEQSGCLLTNFKRVSFDDQSLPLSETFCTMPQPGGISSPPTLIQCHRLSDELTATLFGGTRSFSTVVSTIGLFTPSEKNTKKYVCQVASIEHLSSIRNVRNIKQEGDWDLNGKPVFRECGDSGINLIIKPNNRYFFFVGITDKTNKTFDAKEIDLPKENTCQAGSGYINNTITWSNECRLTYNLYDKESGVKLETILQLNLLSRVYLLKQTKLNTIKEPNF